MTPFARLELRHGGQLRLLQRREDGPLLRTLSSLVADVLCHLLASLRRDAIDLLHVVGHARVQRAQALMEGSACLALRLVLLSVGIVKGLDLRLLRIAEVECGDVRWQAVLVMRCFGNIGRRRGIKGLRGGDAGKSGGEQCDGSLVARGSEVKKKVVWHWVSPWKAPRFGSQGINTATPVKRVCAAVKFGKARARSSPHRYSQAMSSPQILIADDDRALTALLAEYLTREGFVVRAVHDGLSAIAALSEPQYWPEVLVLDVMMPGQDGLDTLRQLRSGHALPVLMLSARGEPLDRIIGLELGADDYLAKPCLPRELLARIKALLRRGAAVSAVQPPLQMGVLELKPAERRASCGGQLLELTGAEFALLQVLMQHAGAVVDKGTLTQRALGRELERYDRAIDVHVSRLRQKLSVASTQSPLIEAVRGAGYQLIAAR